MPVRTRAQANKIRDEELSVQRNVGDNTADSVQVQVTRSETGEGNHTRWNYPTPSPENSLQNSSTQSASDESTAVHTPALQRAEPSKHFASEAPESIPPATPAAPKPLHEARAINPVVDVGEPLYFWRRPGEDIETAIRRNVEMYYREAAQRDAENRRRIRNYVQAHPVQLSEDDVAKMLVREDGAWNGDPFQ